MGADCGGKGECEGSKKQSDGRRLHSSGLSAMFAFDADDGTRLRLIGPGAGAPPLDRHESQRMRAAASAVLNIRRGFAGPG